MYLSLIWFDHIYISSYIYSESYYPVVKHGSHHRQNYEKKNFFFWKKITERDGDIRQTQLHLQDMNEVTTSKRSKIKSKIGVFFSYFNISYQVKRVWSNTFSMCIIWKDFSWKIWHRIEPIFSVNISYHWQGSWASTAG